jgi:hypothetical protein
MEHQLRIKTPTEDGLFKPHATKIDHKLRIKTPTEDGLFKPHATKIHHKLRIRRSAEDGMFEQHALPNTCCLSASHAVASTASSLRRSEQPRTVTVVQLLAERLDLQFLLSKDVFVFPFYLTPNTLHESFPLLGILHSHWNFTSLVDTSRARVYHFDANQFATIFDSMYQQVFKMCTHGKEIGGAVRG